MRSPKPSPAIDAGCTAGTVSLGCRAMRRLASVLAVALTTHACASSQTAGPPPSCSRTEAGAKFALTGFDTMGKMADECGDGKGILVTCFPGTYVYGAMASALAAPMLFVIGSTSDTVQRYQCRPVATPEKATEGTSADVPVALRVGR